MSMAAAWQGIRDATVCVDRFSQLRFQNEIASDRLLGVGVHTWMLLTCATPTFWNSHSSRTTYKVGRCTGTLSFGGLFVRGRFVDTMNPGTRNYSKERVETTRYVDFRLWSLLCNPHN